MANSSLGLTKPGAFNQYRGFMHDLGKHLTTNNIKELVFLSELPGGDTERISSAIDLFKALEEYGKISKDDEGLENLIYLLKMISRHDLVRKVESFSKSMENDPSRPQAVERGVSHEPIQKVASHKPVEKSNSNDLIEKVSNFQSKQKGTDNQTGEKVETSDPVTKPKQISKKNTAGLHLKTPSDFEKKKAKAVDEEKTIQTPNYKEKISKEFSELKLSPSENLSVYPSEDDAGLTYAFPNASKKIEDEEDSSLKQHQYALAGEGNYKMDKNPKGICLIISNEIFDKTANLDDRKGSEQDVKSIEQTFKKLGFEIRVHKNVPVAGKDEDNPNMLQILSGLSKEDHSQHNCLIVFLLSHGCEEGVYGVDGQYLDMNCILGEFKNCPSLSGKPKLFFGQFCQGDREENINTDNGPPPRTFSMMNHPKEADIYIGYATPPGYVSWRSETYGSWYISKLCMIFNKHSHEMDLLTMMKRVTKEVTDAYTKKLCRQVPFGVSTLLKNVKFC